jgi:hypothetical protein
MIIALLISFVPVAWSNNDAAWSQEVAVRQGIDPVVRFQARLERDYLIVKATHTTGWHTYAMDNELRAAAALKGKKSLGIEQGIDIRTESGLELEGRWLQTEPRDFSKPELRWFTYGFDQTALFVCRVKKVTSDQVVLRIRGQTCSGDTCCQIDVALQLQAANQAVDQPTQSQADQVTAMLKSLVPVMTADAEAATQEPRPIHRP